MGRIVLEHVSKEFPGGVTAVRDVSLEIANGEFTVLVGPSGCGKTTILRMIAGLEEVTAGEITIGERNVTDAKPKDRDIAMVFQNYALYPHMTVEQNIGFGMRIRRTPKPKVREKVDSTAKVLALLDYLARKPADLSGGQRQRVAIGRAMVREPEAFLMDEPLSNLDAKLRVQMRAELARLHEQLGTTIVYVTHDQVEAMTLGDRVAVLRDGVLQQVDTPQALYNRPANLFVAGFIGSPSMNMVDATVNGDQLEFAGFRLPVPPDAPLDAYRGRSVILGIRPSDFEDADVWHDERRPVIEVTADVTEDLGSESHVLFTVRAPTIEIEGVRDDGEDGDVGGGPIPLVASEGTSVFTAAVDARTAARPGRKVRLSVNPARFHFFDRDSGEAIVAEEPAGSGTASGAGAGDAGAADGAPAAATSDAKAN
jgi:multiple sugar transport system ATP-binding protein